VVVDLPESDSPIVQIDARCRCTGLGRPDLIKGEQLNSKQGDSMSSGEGSTRAHVDEAGLWQAHKRKSASGWHRDRRHPRVGSKSKEDEYEPSINCSLDDRTDIIRQGDKC